MMNTKILSTGDLVSVFNERNETIMVLPVEKVTTMRVVAGGVAFNRGTGFVVANQASKDSIEYTPVTTRQNVKPIKLRLVATRIEAFDASQLESVETEQTMIANRKKNCSGTLHALKKAIAIRLEQDGITGQTARNVRVLKNSISFDVTVTQAESPDAYVERVFRAPKLARLHRQNRYYTPAQVEQPVRKAA